MNLSWRPRRTEAFTFMELLIVIAVVAILLAALLPALARGRTRSSRINCINNLKQISLSFQQWALDNGDKFPMQVSVTNGGAMDGIASGNVCANFQVMSNELNSPKILICPDDNESGRSAATVFGNNAAAVSAGQIPFSTNNVAYFVGADAEKSMTWMLLSGDDNLTHANLRIRSGLVGLWTNSPVGWTARRHK